MLNSWNRFEVRSGATDVAPQAVQQLLRELAGASREARALVPPADVLETEEGLVLQVELPGHDPQSIEVKVEKETLSVRSERALAQPAGSKVLRRERGAGTYARSFVLPQYVDASRVEARYEQGVLTLVLPRREESKPRHIKVQG